jgi:hypothetical protein
MAGDAKPAAQHRTLRPIIDNFAVSQETTQSRTLLRSAPHAIECCTAVRGKVMRKLASSFPLGGFTAQTAAQTLSRTRVILSSLEDLLQ